jgi:pimeloyl-ACP methyl ester carboxylesterase
MPPIRQRLRRVRVGLAAAILGAVGLGAVLGLALDVARVGGPEAWLALRRGSPPYEPLGRRVPLPDGRAVYLDCRGPTAPPDTPTIVFESGIGAGAGAWGLVFAATADRGRACVYDRPGLGRSDPRGRHTVADTAADLRSALAEAGERPPFVVVAHSLGAVYARVFAARHGPEVVGLVLVDPFNPDLYERTIAPLDPTAQEQGRRGMAAAFAQIEAVEGLDWAASSAELAASSVAGLPIEILSVDQRSWFPPEVRGAVPFEAIEAAWRAGLEGLSPGRVRITVVGGAGHHIQFDRPDLVLAAIGRILDAVDED